MTKDEMMRAYYLESADHNYEEAQRRIIKAMQNGEKHVLLPGKGTTYDFKWTAKPETIERLRDDGFNIDVIWNPYEYWSVEWGY